MATKTTEDRTQNRASNISLHPLTPEQAISGMFKIKASDVKRIVGKAKRRRA